MSRTGHAKRCAATSCASATSRATEQPIRATWWVRSSTGFSNCACRSAAPESTRSPTSCATRWWKQGARSGGGLSALFGSELHMTRAAEPVSLSGRHPERGEPIRRRLVLDALRNDRRAGAARVGNGRLDDGTRSTFDAGLSDALGHLHELRDGCSEQLERGVAFADVVERELKAVLAIAGQHQPEALLVGDRLALGDLEHHRLRVTTSPAREQEHVIDGMERIQEHRR